MAMTYGACATLFARRKKGAAYKAIAKDHRLYYDEREDCYMHEHHSTITVKIYRDKYWVSVGG